MSATVGLTNKRMGLWPWINRYCIQGIFTCRSSLHVGSGNSSSEPDPERGIKLDSLVETGYSGSPMIPGSAVRGVLRAFLEETCGSRKTNGGPTDPRSQPLVDSLFGPEAEANNFCRSKLSFEDAKLVIAASPPVSNAEPIWTSKHPPYWVKSRGTYVVTSVSIDPVTRAAAPTRLYNIEVVPAGAQFSVSIVGWNLEDDELAMLLWALNKFNHPAGMLTLGAHAGRGFGRVDWRLAEISRLGSATRDPHSAAIKWREHLANIDGTVRHLRGLKGEQIDDKSFTSHWSPPVGSTNEFNVSIAYTLKLESNLAIRDQPGSDEAEQRIPDLVGFRLDTGDNPKRRGERVGFDLPISLSAPSGSEVASLAWQMVFDEQSRSYRPQFQIPGSSLRGVFRASLPKDEQEELFGSPDSRGRFEIENAVPFVSRTLPLNWHWQTWQNPPNGSGQEFRVETRGPVDRITSGAKSGGLHSFLSVERGSKFRGRIFVRRAGASDIEILKRWRNALESGQIVLGGVGAAGYGRVSVTIDSAVALQNSTSEQLSDAELPPVIKHALTALTDPTPNRNPSGPPATGRPLVLPPAVNNPDSIPQEHPHYMNPYDFVPFRRTGGGYVAPKLATIDEWEQGGRILSGSITVSLEALQPLHVSGRWSGQSVAFHRGSGGAPLIPGASLRGMLRAYIEALWNCWVSTYSRNLDEPAQTLGNDATTARRNPYAKLLDERYVGFNSDTRWRDYHRGNPARPKDWSDPAIPQPFFSPVANAVDWKSQPIDLASFMFGTVLRVKDAPHHEPQAPSLRGRLRVSDCVLSSPDLDSSYWVPDLADRNAFIGGPQPSKSSMFYFNYDGAEVSWRKAGGKFNVAQFRAGAFRGRKFYFHQDWKACVESYCDSASTENFWARGRPQGAVTPRMLESLKPGQPATFTIYFDRLPRRCLLLLLGAIEPLGRVRHKLGYAKPFGFGSVRLIVQRVIVDEVEQTVADLWQEIAQQDWSWACQLDTLVYSNKYLRYILTYPETVPELSEHLFAYPGYKQNEPAAWVAGFAVPNRDPNHPELGLANPDDRRPAKLADAKHYWNEGVKYTLDLGLYQRRSTHFAGVCRRAGVSPNDIHSYAI